MINRLVVAVTNWIIRHARRGALHSSAGCLARAALLIAPFASISLIAGSSNSESAEVGEHGDIAFPERLLRAFDLLNQKAGRCEYAIRAKVHNSSTGIVSSSIADVANGDAGSVISTTSAKVASGNETGEWSEQTFVGYNRTYRWQGVMPRTSSNLDLKDVSGGANVFESAEFRRARAHPGLRLIDFIFWHDLVRHKAFKVVSVRDVADGPFEGVEIEFVVDPTEEQWKPSKSGGASMQVYKIRNAMATFSGKNGWLPVVVTFDVMYYGDRTWTSCRSVLEFESGQAPDLPVRWLHERTFLDDQSGQTVEVRMEFVYSFRSVDSDIPASRFMLSGYGYPEPVFESNRKWFAWRAAIAAAILVVMVATLRTFMVSKC